jgi:hypothetical protein
VHMRIQTLSGRPTSPRKRMGRFEYFYRFASPERFPSFLCIVVSQASDCIKLLLSFCGGAGVSWQGLRLQKSVNVHDKLGELRPDCVVLADSEWSSTSCSIIRL